MVAFSCCQQLDTNRLQTVHFDGIILVVVVFVREWRNGSTNTKCFAPFYATYGGMVGFVPIYLVIIQ